MLIFRKLFFLVIMFSFTAASCLPAANPAPASTATLTPLPSITPTATPIMDTITGSLRNQIAILEGNMPRADSEGYVIPTDQEQVEFADLVPMLESGDLIRAVRLADQNYFTITYYVDRGDDRAVSYLLREKKPIQKGWGLYAFRVASTSKVIVEAPHPLYDDRTPSVALDIYRALDAHALLIAGAHRNANRDGSADVAHEPRSIFHAIQTALYAEIRETSENPVILQIHGFAESKHSKYPQVVLGAGETIETSESEFIKSLAEALTRRGVEVGACDGKSWQDLCGTENVQAAIVTEGMFIHIELSEKIRKHDETLIAALLEVLRK